MTPLMHEMGRELRSPRSQKCHTTGTSLTLQVIRCTLLLPYGQLFSGRHHTSKKQDFHVNLDINAHTRRAAAVKFQFWLDHVTSQMMPRGPPFHPG